MLRFFGPVVVSLLGAGATSLVPSLARADDAPPEALRDAPSAPMPAPHGRVPYMHLEGTIAVGTGLRFNNPYRLATPLGNDAESVSRTATYLDLGAGVRFGSPAWFQHGPLMRMSFSLEGVHQEVLTPGYAVCRAFRAFEPCVRVGVPLVLRPDANVGVEAGVALHYFVRAGIGVMAEGVGDLFYGAGTREVAYPAYPMLSIQGGLVVALEALP
ncbi:MAG: hypothetical protein U0235_24810 [Polyangiaceae bacterium]